MLHITFILILKHSNLNLYHLIVITYKNCSFREKVREGGREGEMTQTMSTHE
jgi:hypothetical protein